MDNDITQYGYILSANNVEYNNFVVYMTLFYLYNMCIVSY